MIKAKNGPKAVLSLAFLLLLSGCGISGEEELQAWMTEQRSLSKSRVDRIPEPTKFSPQPYSLDAAIEPFSNQKLTQALKKDSATQASANAALIAPELARRKEPLEAYPLDSVAMVGSLLNSGQPVALVRVDSLLYQVRAGSYLGQNYGRITKIAETGITLREIVQDAGGEWIERMATIQLQEVPR
ncbi:MAG: pilus assembly protein PilP [Pseudomonadota bacterium]